MVERSPFELLGGVLEVYRLLKKDMLQEKILVLSVWYERYWLWMKNSGMRCGI